ncbi:MAG: hypothetical protein R3E10_09555 [Gemmatimonadota bacterium]
MLSPSHTLRLAFSAILLALSTLHPPPVQGQQGDVDPGRVEGALEASVGATSLTGKAVPLWGLSAGVWIGRRFYLGGQGRSLPDALDLQRAGGEERLHFGYGGLQVRVRAWSRPGADVDLGVLVGAGRARLRDALVGFEKGADNAFLLEPSLRARRGFLGGRLHLGAALGFRQAWGVEDLPGLVPGDLGGPTAALSLSVERR